MRKNEMNIYNTREEKKSIYTMKKWTGERQRKKMKSFSLIRHNADSDIVDNCGNFEEEVYQIMKRG